MNIYFTMEELNPNGHPLTKEQEQNLNTSITSLSLLRSDYGKPMIVTDGFRTPDEHRVIYANKAKIPWGSQHLKGCAIDIWDRDKRLAAFVTANYHLLEKYGLWCEDVISTSVWVHFQTKPPASGMRFFKPGV